MKTDLEKFIELYESFGIKLVPEKHSEVDNERLTFKEYIEVGMRLPYDSEYAGNSDKFCGYIGFCSVVTFDINGKFIKQGFYE